MTSKRTALLKKIFVGRDITTDAISLDMEPAILSSLVGKGKNIGGLVILTRTAVAIGKLTGADPRAILMAQMEDELLEAGVLPPTKLPADVAKSESAAPFSTPDPSKKISSRSPFGKRYSFTLD